MKALVLYDSNYGNTKRIAEIIAKELEKNTKAIPVSEFDTNDLKGITLLVVGSPINGWRPSEKMGKFLEQLKPDQLKGIKAASFDTRIDIFFHGDATQKIAKKLKAVGAEIISTPHAFFVKGKEGPLVDGELEKAQQWAATLTAY